MNGKILTTEESTVVQVIAWCHQETSHYLNQCWTRGPLLEGFSIVIQIRWKIGLSVTPPSGTVSLHYFTHATTVQLSCYMQNFMVITFIKRKIRQERHEICIELALTLMNFSWNGPQSYVAIRRYYATVWGGTIWRHWTRSTLRVHLIACYPDGTNPLVIYHL